jgi:hypothetical protein
MGRPTPPVRKSNSTLDELLKEHAQFLVPKSAQKFPWKLFRPLFHPGVYVIFKGKKPIYIGQGAQLMKRLVHSNGKALDNGTALSIYPCPNQKCAIKLERKLINALNPQFNTHHRRSI